MWQMTVFKGDFLGKSCLFCGDFWEIFPIFANFLRKSLFCAAFLRKCCSLLIFEESAFFADFSEKTGVCCDFLRKSCLFRC